VKQYWYGQEQIRWRRDIRLLGEIGGLILLLWLAWPRPLQAQDTNGIRQPASGDTIAEVVIIEGTATDPNFLRYELAFLQEANSGAGWIVFAEGDRPVLNGTLAIWDTTVGRNAGVPAFPDGTYQLRLRVVRTDYNYNEYFVRSLLLTNDQPTPTPTITETVTAVTATPRQTPAAEFVAPTPALLPSLTPFPTPTRPPVPQDRGAIAAGRTDATDTGEQAEAAPGLQGRLAALETSSLGRAFWQGAMLTFYLFVALFLYLPLRALLRRGRRLLLKLRYRR
jgi:hypothetical protein